MEISYKDIGSFMMGLEFALNSINYDKILEFAYMIRDLIPYEVLIEKVPLVFDKHYIDNSFIKASRDAYIKKYGLDIHIIILLDLMMKLSLKDRIKIIMYNMFSEFWEKDRNNEVLKEFTVMDNNMKDEFNSLQKRNLYSIIKEKDNEVLKLLNNKVYKSTIVKY